MKYIDLLNIDKGLGLVKDKELTGASVGFLHTLIKNQKELSRQLETFEETRNKIVSDKLSAEEIEDKIKELLMTEVEVDLQKLSVEDISKIQGVTLEVLVLLGDIIEE